MRIRPGMARSRAHTAGPDGVAVFRTLLLCAAVVTIAALTGALLSAAAPANDPAPPRPSVATATPERPDAAAATGTAADQSGGVDPALARSMVYTGTVALAVSVVGLVMVGRRRRLW